MTNPVKPGPVYSVSIFGERREEPPRVSDRSRDASLLRQLTTNQQRHSSATSTSQRGLGVVDNRLQHPPFDVDNRVAGATCRVEISSADRSAAEAASTRPEPRRNPSAHHSDQREERREGSPSAAAQVIAIHAPVFRAPVPPAAAANPPRIGRPPGSSSRPRISSGDTSRGAPPTRLSGVQSELRSCAILRRL